ncbi:unnamed protein product [Owenia fusiformis]|uniref:Uncharacterized protein n=1 Tax=Owenia fusiformis TaxID=6347 RepID=A0A8J1XWZ4_OWEFU|nr:unnamed protein product [Owenia fusiformis]
MQNQIQLQRGRGGYQRQQDIDTIQPKRPGGRVEQFNGKAAIIIGFIMIGFGIVSINLGGTAIALRSSMFRIGTGIWCGLLFFILTGSIGIAAGRSKSKCLIVIFMVLSILMASVACVTLLVISSLGMAQDVPWLNYEYQCYDNIKYNYYHCENREFRVAINALLVATSIIQAVLSIISSAYCCKAVCCCSKANVPTAQETQNICHILTQGQQQGVPAITTNGQHVIIVPGQSINAASLPQMHVPNQPGVYTINIAPGYNTTIQEPPTYTPTMSQAQTEGEVAPQNAEKARQTMDSSNQMVD